MTLIVKKVWTTPVLSVISKDPILAKNNPAVREFTGHYVTLDSLGYKAILSAGNKVAFVIRRNSVDVAHKTDLVS